MQIMQKVCKYVILNTLNATYEINKYIYLFCILFDFAFRIHNMQATYKKLCIIYFYWLSFPNKL